MRAYAIRRLLMVIPTLFLVTVLVFLSVRFLPSDVIGIMQSRLEASQGGEIDRAALERRLGIGCAGLRPVVGSQIQAASVAASQYSSRPSKRSISVRGRWTGLQPRERRLLGARAFRYAGRFGWRSFGGGHAGKDRPRRGGRQDCRPPGPPDFRRMVSPAISSAQGAGGMSPGDGQQRVGRQAVVRRPAATGAVRACSDWTRRPTSSIYPQNPAKCPSKPFPTTADTADTPRGPPTRLPCATSNINPRPALIRRLQVRNDVRCGLRSPPQSRPNPRGGSTLSSSARSSPHIASSRCASADSWRLSGKWSSHA